MKIERFNKLMSNRIMLDIELSEDREQIGDLYNSKAPKSAKIVSASLNIDPPLSTKVLSETVFNSATLCLQSSGTPVTHFAKNGKSFSVEELLKAIEDTEKLARPNSEWFGGIDCHHVFFEGLEEKDGKYYISWGS